MDVTADELRVSYRAPGTIDEAKSAIETIAEFRVPRGEPRVE